jgi:biopolymer transport protein ExbD
MNCSAIFTGTGRRKLHRVRFTGNAIMSLVLVLLAVPGSTAQAPQRGISVDLASADNTIAVPEADKEDAAITTVSEDGSIYVGTSLIPPAALVEAVRDTLSGQAEKKFYIKADARTPYANVLKVLEAARMAGVETPILLTSGKKASRPGTVTPPQGLEVQIGLSLPTGTESRPLGQVLITRQGWPPVELNGERISWTVLRSSLRLLLQNQSEKVILVNADGLVPFSQVVEVIDTCRSMQAKVVLPAPRA